MIDLAEPNEEIQELLKALEKISFMSVLGWEFKDQDVYLDGKEFVDCKFKNCRLVSHLGHWRIKGKCPMDDCHFDFQYPAGVIWDTTLKLVETNNPLSHKEHQDKPNQHS